MTDLTAAKPKPGAKIQVIGIGLPRTATNSFCTAVGILLDGPAYHVGVQTALGDSETDVKTWIEILQKRRTGSEADRQHALKLLARILDGYVVTSDTPIAQLTPELLEIFPDATFVFTTREEQAWSKSVEFITSKVNPIQNIIFFWIKNLRWAPRMWNLFGKIYDERYACPMRSKEQALETLKKHKVWVEGIVPKDQLVYVDVTKGWGPLCKALNKPEPKGVPFPRLNEAKSYEAVFTGWAIQGIIRWLLAMVLTMLFVYTSLKSVQAYARIQADYQFQSGGFTSSFYARGYAETVACRFDEPIVHRLAEVF